jgi:hypothetical protein
MRRPGEARVSRSWSRTTTRTLRESHSSKKASSPRADRPIRSNLVAYTADSLPAWMERRSSLNARRSPASPGRARSMNSSASGAADRSRVSCSSTDWSDAETRTYSAFGAGSSGTRKLGDRIAPGGRKSLRFDALVRAVSHCRHLSPSPPRGLAAPPHGSGSTKPSWPPSPERCGPHLPGPRPRLGEGGRAPVVPNRAPSQGSARRPEPGSGGFTTGAEGWGRLTPPPRDRRRGSPKSSGSRVRHSGRTCRG